MIISYYDCQFYFVTNHYDIHLSGICWYENDLCRFDLQDEEAMTIKITRLTLRQKIKELSIKKLFEWLVGYNWSYTRDGKKYPFCYENIIQRNLSDNIKQRMIYLFYKIRRIQ